MVIVMTKSQYALTTIILGQIVQFYALMYQIVLDAIEINIALNVLIRHFTDKIVMILAQIALVSVISVTLMVYATIKQDYVKMIH
jgi:hypothetical protein